MKKIILTLLFIFICSVSYASAEENPMIYYSFDDKDIILMDNQHEITDLSGNGYNACGSGTKEVVSDFSSSAHYYTVTAVKGECMKSGAEIPAGAFLNVEDFTMNLWLSSPPKGDIFVAESSVGNMTIKGTWGSGLTRTMSYFQDGAEVFPMSPKITSQEFYSKMWMYTIVKSEDEVKIYFEGVEQTALMEYPDKTELISLAEIASGENAVFYLSGDVYIDEFSFYNTALSDDEIKKFLEVERPTISAKSEKIIPIGKYADTVQIEKEISEGNMLFTVMPYEESAVDISDIDLFVAEYDENGYLFSIKRGVNEISANGISISLDLPETEIYKIVLCDNNMTPLINAITDI